jgi:hypothetical protein
MEPSTLNDQQPADSAPTETTTNVPSETTAQTGLLEIVEAFTSMRHEWRTQSKQGRELGQSIKQSAELIAGIEATLEKKLTAVNGENSVRNLVSVIIDLDIGLTRAVETTAAIRETRKSETTTLIQKSFQRSGLITRWFGRQFYRQLIEDFENNFDARPDSTVEGWQLLLNRLRRKMSENGLTRAETVGLAFDGKTMKAISSVKTEQFEVGVVAEQINPAYLYRGETVRLAEVRVAN